MLHALRECIKVRIIWFSLVAEYVIIGGSHLRDLMAKYVKQRWIEAQFNAK